MPLDEKISADFLFEQFHSLHERYIREYYVLNGSAGLSTKSSYGERGQLYNTVDLESDFKF